MRHDRSVTLYESACHIIPGGVNSPVRAFQSVGMPPIFVERGEGATLYDVDGNAYTDYICSWGPLILGHASEVYYRGVEDALKHGNTYGAPTALEVSLATLITEALPSVDMVRMVNSGTEAAMSAIRVARGYTGKHKIIKFEGCYHGHSDALLVKSGSGALTYGVPTSAGVTPGAACDTLVATFNDIDSVAALFEENRGEISGVIVEPVAGNMGVVAPQPEFLADLRALTSANNALLIFDEVITGFRLSYSGAQGLYGIDPDLTILGKIIGGGMPVGAFGGKREIMNCLAPNGPVYQAGTLSGNPIAMTMGINTLTYLKNHPEVYDHMESLAIRLEKGFNDNIKKTGINATLTREKAMLTLFFAKGPMVNFNSVKQSDTALYARYFKEMLDRGQLMPPSQFEGIFLSYAHTEALIDETIEANRAALQAITSME